MELSRPVIRNKRRSSEYYRLDETGRVLRLVTTNRCAPRCLQVFTGGNSSGYGGTRLTNKYWPKVAGWNSMPGEVTCVLGSPPPQSARARADAERSIPTRDSSSTTAKIEATEPHPISELSSIMGPDQSTNGQLAEFGRLLSISTSGLTEYRSNTPPSPLPQRHLCTARGALNK